MNSRMLSEAMGELDSKYIKEALNYKRSSKKTAWVKRGAMAACICLLIAGGFGISQFFQNPSHDNTPYDSTPQDNTPQDSTPQDSTPSATDQTFVEISSLLPESGTSVYETAEMAQMLVTIPIEQYTGIFEKVASAGDEVLSQSCGESVATGETWYRVLGHTDMQYLIRNEGEVYSLWKFLCFDSQEYLYSDVLELIYQIDSADVIAEIIVDPATMDNTDSGKAIQSQIGTLAVSDRAEIETFYKIISSITCYGQDRWDIIDYGSLSEAADGSSSSVSPVWLGRYLTIVTDYGNKIDGLKYTAVSNMFYEYNGIAYNQLTEEQAASICDILHIDRSADSMSVSEG